MDRISVPLLMLGLSLVGAAQTTPSKFPIRDRFFTRSRHGSDWQAQTALPVKATGLPAVASAGVISTQCPPAAIASAQNAGVTVSCGFVPVPFDRKHPKQGTISIYFEQYLHTGSGSAESAILVRWGGAGRAATGVRDYLLSLFGPNLDVHDLLLVDSRGSGGSGAILCPELQYGIGPWIDELSECASELGDTASRYGSGDIAEDMDAVRASLGYALVDFDGTSSGAVQAIAYATRFGEHIRSIVLDSPYGGPVLYKFDLDDRDRALSEHRMVRLDCQRSPTCSPDHPDPDAELDQLIQSLRTNPVQGYGYTSDGRRLYVRADETVLLNFLLDYPTGNFDDTGEILAAGRSLAQGDPAPLLRLVAEEIYSLPFNSGDPTIFSVGANFNTSCMDLDLPWNWHVAMAQRLSQYQDAIEALPEMYFARFSKAAATSLEFSLSANCLWWQKPTHSSPVLPPHPHYPNVPTLVLSDDMDNLVPLEETTKVAALFPGSTLVKIVEAGHPAASWTTCAFNLTSHFIETLQVGDTSCANTPQMVFPAVGRFPLLAKDARTAKIDPSGNNQIGEAERKVVTVAVATATDAMQRSILLSLFHPGLSDGVGLRAGTFHTDFSNPNLWTTTLTNCAFAQDVTVNGTITWGVYASPFNADLTVSGTGTGGGTLHVEGVWQTPGPVGSFTISGTIGGLNVAVLVPEE